MYLILIVFPSLSIRFPDQLPETQSDEQGRACLSSRRCCRVVARAPPPFAKAFSDELVARELCVESTLRHPDPGKNF